MLKRNLLITIFLVLFLQFIAFAADTTLDQYVLGPGDVIEFSVWNHPELRQQVTIRPDGLINLLPVGELVVTGMTPSQLAERTTVLLKELINSPKVNISVISFKQTEISILGAVTRPGVYKVTPKTRLLDALALAGVNQEIGFLEEVTLTRNNTVIKVNVSKLLAEGGIQNYVLQTGDVVFVPMIVRQVYILGQVISPGSYKIKQTTTPADLLAMAGGPTKRADLERVKLIRRQGAGKVEIINLKDFLKSDVALELPYLQDGDIIEVAETKSINWEKVFTYAAGIKLIHDLIVNW